jgi:hypothetical protein
MDEEAGRAPPTRARQFTLSTLFADVPKQAKRKSSEKHEQMDSARKGRIKKRNEEDRVRAHTHARKAKEERAVRLAQKQEQARATKRNLERANLLEHLHRAWENDFDASGRPVQSNTFRPEQMRAVDHIVASDGGFGGELPFEQKDAAKEIGARWDGDLRCWYAPTLEVAYELMTRVDWSLVHTRENCCRDSAVRFAPLVAKKDEIPTGLAPWTKKQFKRAYDYLHPGPSHAVVPAPLALDVAQAPDAVQSAPSPPPAASSPPLAATAPPVDDDTVASVEADVSKGTMDIIESMGISERRNVRGAVKLVESIRLVSRRSELGIPVDSEKDIERLAAVGVHPIAPFLFDGHPALGPHAGISNASRLIRGFRLHLVVPSKITVKTNVFLDGNGSFPVSDLFGKVVPTRGDKNEWVGGVGCE